MAALDLGSFGPFNPPVPFRGIECGCQSLWLLFTRPFLCQLPTENFITAFYWAICFLIWPPSSFLVLRLLFNISTMQQSVLKPCQSAHSASQITKCFPFNSSQCNMAQINGLGNKVLESIPGSGTSAREGIGYLLQDSQASLMAQLVKNPPAMLETWVWSLLGRSPGEGKGYPLQYSDLENCMECIVYGITKSRTQLSDFHFLSYWIGPRESQGPGFLGKSIYCTRGRETWEGCQNWVSLSSSPTDETSLAQRGEVTYIQWHSISRHSKGPKTIPRSVYQ